MRIKNGGKLFFKDSLTPFFFNKREATKRGNKLKFKNDKFPMLKDYKITESDGKIILEVTKEFNTDINNMKFN